MEARTDEREALVNFMHRRNEFDYDECQHGTYSGGPSNGEPYAMCERQADALIAAGYRKHPEPEVTDEMREAAFAEAWGFRAETRSYGERLHLEGWFNRGWRAFQAALRVPVGEGEQQ